MDPQTFEPFEISENLMKESKFWLKGEEICSVTFWNEKPIQVEASIFVELEVIQTSAYSKGDTVNHPRKMAVLSTGGSIKVPAFIQVVEMIKIDTRSGSYVSRILKN